MGINLTLASPTILHLSYIRTKFKPPATRSMLSQVVVLTCAINIHAPNDSVDPSSLGGLNSVWMDGRCKILSNWQCPMTTAPKILPGPCGGVLWFANWSVVVDHVHGRSSHFGALYSLRNRSVNRNMPCRFFLFCS